MRLGSLEVRVDAADVRIERRCRSPTHPGGRPSSVVRLSGAGHTGQGENVAFELDEHERFVRTVSEWFREHASERRLEVGSALPSLPSPYERAALEAALIDLALRQANLTLAALTDTEWGSLRFVASLGATAEPLAAIASWRRAGFRGDLKLDADPSWPGGVQRALGDTTGVAIVDFKRRGDAAFAQALAALFPDARLEDPPDGWTPDAPPARIARDATLLGEDDVVAALARGESVNLKAPRMGGPLAVLRSLEHASRRSAMQPTGMPPNGSTPASPEPLAYLGGMFEVGIGRTQARLLAALYCPDAPNDLALNERARRPAPRAVSTTRPRSCASTRQGSAATFRSHQIW